MIIGQTGKQSIGAEKLFMDFKRTSDQRFENLEDYPFQPNYLSIDDTEGGQLRIHYLDEGPADGDVVLLLHGQPAWSYLYRHMMPPLIEAGFRVIAPDLVGFGRSDKPIRQEDYTYARHVAWMSDWLVQLDLKDITVFLQDWGSLIGLRLLAAFEQRFARVVLANGGLPTGMVPVEYTDFLKDAYTTLPVVKARELGERFADTTGIPGFLYWRKFLCGKFFIYPKSRFAPVGIPSQPGDGPLIRICRFCVHGGYRSLCAALLGYKKNVRVERLLPAVSQT